MILFSPRLLPVMRDSTGVTRMSPTSRRLDFNELKIGGNDERSQPVISGD